METGTTESSPDVIEPAGTISGSLSGATDSEPETGGTTGNDYEPVDPATAESTESASGTLNGGSGKRTRKSSKSNRSGKRTAGKRKENKEKDTASLELLLFSTHLMLAKMMKVDEIALSEEEAKQLGQALGRVNELYDLSALSPRTVAWINFLTVAGGIYIPRVMAYNMAGRKGPATKKPIVIDIADASQTTK